MEFKKKYFNRETPIQYTPGHWIMNEQKKNMIDNETILLKPSINYRDKNNQSIEYYNNKNISAGRGFGNLNISNEIRKGNASRSDKESFKEYIENKQFFDFRFNYLDKNFQNPDNLVLPFPRGGDSTRRLNKCNKIKDELFNNKIHFEY
jgi:hypothetical protein